MAGRLSAGRFALAYLGALVAIGILDGVWLGWVAKGMYQREMGELMAPSFRVWTMVLFYLLYPLAIVYLCVHGPRASVRDAVARGAVLGAAAYGAYDLTNASIIRGWPMGIVAVDWAWGTALTAVAAGVAWRAARGRANG